MALTAGCDVARGEALILMDSDLQHPPELIPAMVARWLAGAEVVSAVRKRTEGAPFFKLLTARLFYAFLNSISDIRIEPEPRTSCCSHAAPTRRSCACRSGTASCVA